MALLKLAAIGTLAFVGYKYYEKSKSERHAAFAEGQSGTVRDAGPEAMADKPARKWSETDEASDESFPASDPPATY
ncbi:uncharacterized membrane protein YebE (DUF533 family) [Altererythrobacter atlanticus]|uniref:Uncharacterized protein n=1 Tax=Croceibacterium atlanticum TaxID=1267766 RepID=A0A0F7KU78_9SPHN|nr:hypothetical protein [Croceibacterium atlanticum]AKH43159.1 hypothetical protein WYH_02125 [Croceibacterium atlanticum]MBB5732136.1 uncharacterized membrane protein YebE (DUF533 family) [Croceibacterium atlanticum]